MAARGRRPVDARGRLVDDPFDCRITKDGRVLVSRGGRQVCVIAPPAADRLVRSLAAAADERSRQLLLARATGSYKRGNERR